jgi:hypothetical protein
MRSKHTFPPASGSCGQARRLCRAQRSAAGFSRGGSACLDLSPDGADRLEAALARRLDRMTRQIERLERHITISNEALAVFVRFWLTSTPPFPDTAQIKGRERCEGFVEALGRRLARGRKLADEITRDVEPVAPKNDVNSG